MTKPRVPHVPSQLEISPLKAEAERNMYVMVVAELVSQLDISPLKVLAVEQ